MQLDLAHDITEVLPADSGSSACQTPVLKSFEMYFRTSSVAAYQLSLEHSKWIAVMNTPSRSYVDCMQRDLTLSWTRKIIRNSNASVPIVVP